MNSIELKQLKKIDVIDEIQVHSIECSLFIIRVILNGQFFKVTENHKPYKRHAIESIKKDLEHVHINQFSLLHSSAYDEMIAQPPREISNTLHLSSSNPSQAKNKIM